jgi:hypothetical protein
VSRPTTYKTLRAHTDYSTGFAFPLQSSPAASVILLPRTPGYPGPWTIIRRVAGLPDWMWTGTDWQLAPESEDELFCFTCDEAHQLVDEVVAAEEIRHRTWQLGRAHQAPGEDEHLAEFAQVAA